MADNPGDAGLALPPLGFEEPREILSASRRAAPQPQFIWQNPSTTSLQQTAQAQLRLDDVQAGNVEASRGVSVAV
jgi:hypothetical protein